MSEFARLEEKLAKLRARERAVGEARTLRGVGADGLLSALITEIDETILPRRLTFSADAGVVHLAVANRRLQALLAPAPRGIRAALAGTELPDVEEPAVAELGEALKALFEGTEAVTVSSTRLTDNFGSDIGVPAEQLPRVWSVQASVPRTPDDILESFISGLDGRSVAWLRIEGEEVTGQGGPKKIVDALGEHAAIFLDGYFSKFDQAFREPAFACGTLISPGAGAGRALFFAEVETLSVFVSAAPKSILGIATAWQRLVAE